MFCYNGCGGGYWMIGYFGLRGYIIIGRVSVDFLWFLGYVENRNHSVARAQGVSFLV